MKKSDLGNMIREAIQNALKESSEMTRETPEEKKARLDGKKQALEKLQGKTSEELKASYLKVEQQAERDYKDPLRHAFLWGALDQIKFMLKQQGEGLPKKSRDPWTR
jgi:hypothetical protein